MRLLLLLSDLGVISMSDLSRRGFIAKLGPQKRHGDLRDIKHVVVLMQENRSFDHYFGSLRGVRGFGDRSTIPLPGGYSVFQQPPPRPVARSAAPSTRGG